MILREIGKSTYIRKQISIVFRCFAKERVSNNWKQPSTSFVGRFPSGRLGKMQSRLFSCRIDPVVESKLSKSLNTCALQGIFFIHKSGSYFISPVCLHHGIYLPDFRPLAAKDMIKRRTYSALFGCSRPDILQVEGYPSEA